MLLGSAVLPGVKTRRLLGQGRRYTAGGAGGRIQRRSAGWGVMFWVAGCEASAASRLEGIIERERMRSRVRSR